MVFSSFEPEDLRTEQTSSVGLAHLRAYLEQAKYGVPERVRSEVAVDRHAEQIATALRAVGCTVLTEVGLSDFRVDLAVAAPGRGEVPTLAVLLDGPSWAARATTGDRDGAPVAVLSAIMGWPGWPGCGCRPGCPIPMGWCVISSRGRRPRPRCHVRSGR